jgi:hypothetical protein
MPKVTKGTCTTGECGFRVAILSKNASLVNKPQYPVLQEEFARQIFFPDCKNSDDDFIFLKGTQDEINAALAKLEYQPIGV